MSRRVQDVMTEKVVVVGEDAPFKEIVRLMDEHRVSALPVVDGAERIVGVVSEADLLPKEGEQAEEGHHIFEGRRRRVARAKAEALTAGELMSAPAITIGPRATLAEAARTMSDRRVKRLPVVDEEGRVIGIASRADLLRVFLRPDGEIREEVVRDVIEHALWIDPGSIRVDVREGVVSLEGRIEQRSLIAVLVRLVMSVDGVVGVDERLAFEIDDTQSRPWVAGPWGIVPETLHPRDGSLRTP